MKTSIVYATIKCIVQHEDDQNAEDVVNDANYNISDENGKIIETEMTEVESSGYCHPTEHYLLDDENEE